jgi:predicted MFS family arabinose efflux permease
MALVVNNVDESERASAMSSFTMFFELGTIVGGLALGLVGELFGKRAGFAGGAVLCLVGLVTLWTRVASPRRAPAPAHPEFVRVACD